MQRFDPRESPRLPSQARTVGPTGRSDEAASDEALAALASLRQGERSAAAAYRHVATFESFGELRATLLTLAEGHETRARVLGAMMSDDCRCEPEEATEGADTSTPPWEALRRPLGRSTTAEGRRATLAVLGEGERFRYLHALRAERVVPEALGVRLAREVVAGQREALATAERLSKSSA
jgi:hypothetical protein